VAAGLAVAIGVLGLAVGAIWWAVAPRIEAIQTERGPVYADNQLEKPVAADGSFLFVGLGAGVVLALLAWLLLRRHRGVVVLVGLVAGSLVSAWVAWRFGIWLDKSRFEQALAAAPVGGHLQGPLSLRTTGLVASDLWPPKLTGVVAAQPLAAAIVYTMLAGFAADPQLRARSEWSADEDDDEAQPSWGLAEPADRTDRSVPPGAG
jgi:hypothetical protein